MKKTLALCGLLLSGCAGMGGMGADPFAAISAGADLFKAATLNDEDVQAMGLQLRDQSDKEAKVAPAGSKHAKRLAKLTKGLAEKEGMPLDFKVYISEDVNAFALPNGSIRFYTGLMDLMTDDELRFVIGHEIGHVKEGHAKSALKTAYTASAARKGVASQGGTAGAIAGSALGDIGMKVVNAQHSQKQETASDEYAYAFMQRHKIPTAAAVSALRKLEKLGSTSSLFASHPAAGKRADQLEKKG